MAWLETYDWDKHEEEQNQKRFLEKDDFWDRCMWCQYLRKELEDKREVCADCIFNTIANIS